MSATTDLAGTASPHIYIDKKLATKKVNVDGVEQETEETVETTYKIRPIDQVFKADFANYHFAVAKETLAEMRDLYSDEEYEEERRQLREDKKAGLFDLISSGGGTFMNTERGQKWVICTLFGINDDTAADLLSRNTEEISQLLIDVFRENISAFDQRWREIEKQKKKDKENADPNSQAPTQAPA